MSVGATHDHAYAPIDEHGERCTICGYARWRGVVGSEYPEEPAKPPLNSH
jgi:hypothetical protein